MDFTIVIPGFNGPERIDYLLESIFKFYPQAADTQIIVSDDCSPKIEEIGNVVRKWNVIFTHPPVWGCVGSNSNHAVSLSRNDLVFVINDDLIISKGTLETMAKFWEDNKHLNLGAAGFTFIQDYQLVEKGIIPTRDKFYPPVWNTGNISRNALEVGHDIFTNKFTRPIVTSTPSGPCFAVSKAAWKASGKFHEFGMWEGGAFHTMWEKGYSILMVPTPPLLHAKSRGTGDNSQFLRDKYSESVQKRPYMHKEGEALYKAKRGKGYDEDTAYIWADVIDPRREEIYNSMVYDFDAERF